MTNAKRNIEVDEATAAALEARAAAPCLSVSDLIVEMTATHGPARVLPREDIAELDRQWMAINHAKSQYRMRKVVRWLQPWGTPSGMQSWGTPDELPPPTSRAVSWAARPSSNGAIRTGRL